MDEIRGNLPTLVTRQYLKEPSSGRVFIVLRTGRGSDWTYIIDTQYTKERRRDHNAPFLRLKTAKIMERLSDNYAPEEDRLVLLEGGLPSPSQRRCSDPSQNRRLCGAATKGNVAERREAATARASKGVAAALLSPGWQRLSGLLTFAEPRDANGDLPKPSIYSDSFLALIEDGTRRSLVDNYCKLTGENRWTMYRTFRAFCQGGMTPEAVVSEYDKCGARGKHRTYAKKPGRRNSISPAEGVPRTETVEIQLRMAAERYLTTTHGIGARKRQSMEDCLLWVLRRYYATEIESDDEGFITKLEIEESIKPSLRQLEYLINTRYTYAERQIARIGVREWDLQQRPLVGQLRNAKGPGECFHIDATRANVYVVNRLMRSKVAGRPYYYTVVDDYSGLVAGVYVGFEPPSWQGVMMALINAVTPKVAYCASMGIDITEAQWPACVLPGRILTDQQFSSVGLCQLLQDTYFINWTCGTPYRPDLRSVSERPFSHSCSTLGAVHSGRRRKGGLR